MTIPPALPQRHALGLPAGSVRAILTLIIVGLVCLVLLVPSRTPMPIPPYLIYLLFLGLGHYFAAHGSSIAPASNSPHPLHLPRGMVRFLLMAMLMGTIGWKLYSDPDRLREQFVMSLEQLKAEPYLPLVLLGGFMVGVLLRTVVGRVNPPYVLQDLEAWLALLAEVGLCTSAIIVVIINPSLEKQISLPHFDAFLAGMVAFYYGERS